MSNVTSFIVVPVVLVMMIALEFEVGKEYFPTIQRLRRSEVVLDINACFSFQAKELLHLRFRHLNGVLEDGPNNQFVTVGSGEGSHVPPELCGVRWQQISQSCGFEVSFGIVGFNMMQGIHKAFQMRVEISLFNHDAQNSQCVWGTIAASNGRAQISTTFNVVVDQVKLSVILFLKVPPLESRL